MSTDKKNINFKSLQLMRAVAVILVVFHHSYHLLISYKGIKSRVLSIFEQGAMGVDIFFVLSGFIIFFIHQKDIGNRNKINSYVLKRFVRIFPVYWILNIFYIILLNINVPLNVFFRSVVLFPENAQPLIGVAWSLRHEILFYFIFGLIIFNKKFFTPLAVIWVVLIAIFFIWPIPTNSAALKLLFNPMNVEFLLGCLIGFLILKVNINFKWCVPVGISCFIVSALAHQFGLLQLDRTIIFGVPSAILILGLVSLEYTKNIHVNKVWVYIGDASYSIYLVHIIVLLYINNKIKFLGIYDKFYHPKLIMVVSAITAILLGCLFYSFIEKPLLKKIKSITISKTKNKNKEKVA